MSAAKEVRFRKHVVDAEPAGTCNDVTLSADITGNGNDEIIIGGKFAAPYDPKTLGKLVWYEHGTWKRHLIGEAVLEAGGVVVDITGNGKPDIVAGEQGQGKELYWWEHPGSDPTQPWKRRLITDRFERYHDQTIGDVDGDGKDELLVLSQNVRKLFYFDIPEDPTVEPWPEDCCHMVCDDILIEGLCVIDVDGDGVNEIVAGHHLFKHNGDPTKPWGVKKLLPELDAARVALGDLNGNGHLDLVLSEAEKPGARLLWLEGPDFTKLHDLGSDYFHLHSLGLADFTGTGTLDIFCGEMHLGGNDNPRVILFRNDGKGNFEPQEFPCPCGTHEGKVVYLGGARKPGIIVKPYSPNNRVEWWENVTD